MTTSPSSTDPDLANWDATETAARIRDGDVSAREVVDAAITRAQKAEPHLDALVTTTYDRAREAADDLDDLGPATRAVFAGVPSAVKDLEDVAGVPTGMGSATFDGYVATRTASSVTQFLSAGPISLGKSTSPEFGLTATTEPTHRPPTRNPWNLAHSVGGSSGGAAALVAGGVVPIAYATDGGGSIRIPAACTGLVGLKPSWGRLAMLETMEKAPVKLAVHGIVSRTVRDTANYLAAVERSSREAHLPPIGHVTGPSNRRLRVALVTDTPHGEQVHPDVVGAVEDTGRLLEGLGHDVVAVRAPSAADIADDFLLYWATLAFGVRLVGLELRGRDFDASRLDPWTQGLADQFKANLRRVPGAIRRLRGFGEVYAAFMQPYDVMVTPTLATPPPPIGHLSPDVPYEVKEQRVKAFACFTPIQNVSGAPAISLPLGRSADGLPIGVQVAGHLGDERALLELAFEVEQAAPWPHRAPDLG